MKEKASPKNCIIQCRVSTAKQAQQGESLEEQELICRGIAERHGWRMLRAFREPYSGRKDRPKVEEIIAFIKTSPEPVHYYLFRGIDRLTRAGVVEYEKLKHRLEALGVQVVDSYGIIQPKQNTLERFGLSYDWSIYSPSEAAELLEAHRGKQEVRDILTRMIGAEIRLTQQGYKVRQAADGFLNEHIDIEGKKRVIEVPDPARAQYFVEMFTLRAAALSDKEIVKSVNALGYRTKPHRVWSASKDQIIGHTKPKPLTVKRLQEIIRRPIYCGVRCEKWTHRQPIRTRYPGLVSIDVWNRANRGKVRIDERPDCSLEIRHGGDIERVPPRRLRNNPLYPYKNVVMCPVCRSKPFLGSASRGRLGTYHPAYHCNRNHYLRIPKGVFEDTVDGFLEGLRLRRGFLGEFERGMLAEYSERRIAVAERRRQVQDHIAALKAQQDGFVDSLATTQAPVARAKIEERIVDLEKRIADAASPTEALGVSPDDLHSFTSWAAELMEHPLARLKDGQNVDRQRALWSLVFEALPTYAEIRNGTPQLSPIFALNRGFESGDSVSVRTHGFGWNTLAPLIATWRATITKHCPDLAAVARPAPRAPRARYRRGHEQAA